MLKGSCAFAFAVIACPAISRAAVIQMEMTGTITTVEDPLGLLPFVHPGDQVVYQFSYDSDAPDGAPSSDSVGLYTGISASLHAGTQILAVSDAPLIDIVHPNDYLEVSSHLTNAGLSNELSGGFVYFRLSDQVESNALTNTNLPVEPYDLSPFAHREFQVFFRGPPRPGGGSEYYNFLFYGNVDTWTLVPEPLSLVMIFPILGLRRFKRSRLALSPVA
jgi:hypothetical protein